MTIYMNKFMTQQTDKKHEFAFYIQKFPYNLSVNLSITIISEDLFHRLKHVLKVALHEVVILFDNNRSIRFVFQKFEGKDKVIGVVQDITEHKKLDPSITFILPLLKIDALSEAVYALAEVGITHIQLVITQKTQTVYSDKILEKLRRVVIAAAEQSKNFAMPIIYPAQHLADVMHFVKHDTKKHAAYHFDVTGVSFLTWYKPVEKNKHYYLFVGPEGDLTIDEKEIVSNAGFVSCLLTQTVLRSVRAISIVSGLFRL